jgi:hypothetical protein
LQCRLTRRAFTSRITVDALAEGGRARSGPVHRSWPSPWAVPQEGACLGVDRDGSPVSPAPGSGAGASLTQWSGSNACSPSTGKQLCFPIFLPSTVLG